MFARIVVALLIGLATSPSVLHSQTTSPPQTLSEAYRKVVPSVVYIEVGSLFEKQGSGSGFLLHKEGYIATAAHVVDQAEVIRVTFHDESRAFARVVTMSRAQDLALLKAEQTPSTASVAKLGDVSSVKPGQPIFCVGSPYDLRFSISSGVVSGLRENVGSRDLVWKSPSRIIQTDTAINVGNSGGPVFNAQGEVIGIVVSRLDPAEGIGWAVPVDLIRHYLVDQAVPFGGVVYLRVTEDFARLMNWPPAEALIVERVQPGSLAYKGGLRGGRLMVDFGELPILLGGDVIYFIGGHPVSEYEEVKSYLRGLTNTDEIKISVWREGKMVDLRAPFQILDPVPNLDLPGSDISPAAQPARFTGGGSWSAGSP